MKKRALCPLSGVHLTIKPQFMAIFIQSNFRENRLFANEWHLVSKKGSHNVKFCAENFTYSQGCEVKSIPNW